ncbi:cupin domain-containing protein [Prauserella muralis]|uniref:Cupin n=1 Tax=Prauserella muralis TaxID=588067 RepID=A0A2V4BBC8_9PSEU|nr:cupin domain-containing protein [Prauserella muralis]PXY32570.1 cupin [Prauserella muralis]TWE23716.1 cupin domain [Prauserella muralis]
MTLVTLAQAPTFTRDGFVFRPLAVPSRGSAELAVWSLEVRPEARSEPHTVDREEVFVLHEGRAVVEVGGVVHELEPGDAAIAAPHTPLRVHNPGPVPARLTVCTSKGIRGTVGDTTIDPPWAR